MRHFGYLSASDTDALFEVPPEPFRRDSGPELLSVALGATLYMPADRPSRYSAEKRVHDTTSPVHDGTRSSV